jgi:hypothetical protein
MICRTRFAPSDFAIENNFSHWQARKGRSDRRGILRQVISREQPHIVAAPESKQSDSIELALETHCGPVKRSCVRVAAIGLTHSGKDTNEL